MNKYILSSAVVLLASGALGVLAAEIKSAEDLKDARQKASYGLGVQAADSWKNRGADIDWDAYFRGIRDTVAGAPKMLSEEQIREAMMQFQKETQVRFEAMQAAVGDINLKAGEKFLAENKTRQDVKFTDSGLQYQVITLGTGPKPSAADRVSVHYSGMLIDGKKFDSSIDRGQPAKLALNGVIKGWTEGLQLMPVGSKFKFFIPPDLGYGLNSPASIGPNQVLIFDVELIEILESKALKQ